MKQTYEGIYKKLDYGPIATARGLQAARHVEILWKPCKVLCVGAGNGYEAFHLSNKGYDVTVIDYVLATPKRPNFKQLVGKAQDLPFEDDKFDIVMCCECLEHIPPNEIDMTLNEFKRVAQFFYFTIDDADDPPYHSHVCIKTPEWWLEKFTKNGLTGKMFKPARFQEMAGGVIANKVYKSGHGFNIYGNKILSKPV